MQYILCRIEFDQKTRKFTSALRLDALKSAYTSRISTPIYHRRNELTQQEISRTNQFDKAPQRKDWPK